MTEEKTITNVLSLEELHKRAENLKQTAPPVYESAELGKLFEALSKAQGEMEVAKEDATNPFYKSPYAALPSVIRSSRPCLNKYGLCVIQRIMANGNGTSYLFTRLCHVSGQWMESRMHLLPLKPDMQWMGGAITYAKRYAYSAMIGVVTEEEDDDGNAACTPPKAKAKENAKPVFITQAQAKTILEHITEAKDESLLNKVLEYYNVSKLSYLPQAVFSECIDRVKNYTKSGEEKSNGGK